MKKTILSVAILLASTLGLTAVAQTPVNSQTGTNQTECTKAGKACKAAKANRPNPFEGLNLTEQQKSELQAIAPQKPARKCDKAQNGACNKAKAGKGEKKDLAAKQQSKADKQAKRAENRQQMIQNRRDYLAKVKNILTPEQYVQFLENNYVDNAFKAGGRHHGKMVQAKHNKGHKDGKNRDMRNGKKGQKGQSGVKSQENANSSNSAYYIDNGKIKVFPYQAQC